MADSSSAVMDGEVSSAFNSASASLAGLLNGEAAGTALLSCAMPTDNAAMIGDVDPSATRHFFGVAPGSGGAAPLPARPLPPNGNQSIPIMPGLPAPVPTPKAKAKSRAKAKATPALPHLPAGSPTPSPTGGDDTPTPRPEPPAKRAKLQLDVPALIQQATLLLSCWLVCICIIYVWVRVSECVK